MARRSVARIGCRVLLRRAARFATKGQDGDRGLTDQPGGFGQGRVGRGVGGQQQVERQPGQTAVGDDDQCDLTLQHRGDGRDQGQIGLAGQSQVTAGRVGFRPVAFSAGWVLMEPKSLGKRGRALARGSDFRCFANPSRPRRVGREGTVRILATRATGRVGQRSAATQVAGELARISARRQIGGQ